MFVRGLGWPRVAELLQTGLPLRHAASQGTEELCAVRVDEKFRAAGFRVLANMSP